MPGELDSSHLVTPKTPRRYSAIGEQNRELWQDLAI